MATYNGIPHTNQLVKLNRNMYCSCQNATDNFVAILGGILHIPVGRNWVGLDQESPNTTSCSELFGERVSFTVPVILEPRGKGNAFC
jgi:hypothetical protein